MASIVAGVSRRPALGGTRRRRASVKSGRINTEYFPTIHGGINMPPEDRRGLDRQILLGVYRQFGMIVFRVENCLGVVRSHLDCRPAQGDLGGRVQAFLRGMSES